MAERRIRSTSANGAAGVDLASGASLTRVQLAERVGWAASIATTLAQSTLEAHWAAGSFDLLEAGVDSAGKQLPSFACVALDRLGWEAPEALPAAWYNLRILRCARETAGRTLRSALARRKLVDALLDTLRTLPLTSEEWQGLSDLPKRQRRELVKWLASTAPGQEVWVRATCRSLLKHAIRTGTVPASFFDIEDAPKLPVRLDLAAADGQILVLEHDARAGTLHLRVKLPTSATPASPREWSWVRMEIRGQEALLSRYSEELRAAGAAEEGTLSWKLCSPRLRVSRETVRIDLGLALPHTRISKRGHLRMMAFDWGENHTLTGRVLVRDPSQTTIGPDGKPRSQIYYEGGPLFFIPEGLQRRYHRVRKHHEKVRAKLARYARLLDGLPETDPRHPFLTEKQQRREVEAQRLSAKMSHLNDEIANLGARWAIEHALANNCTAVAVEDLASMEQTGWRGDTAIRVTAQVRSKLQAVLQVRCQDAKLAYLEVYARNTSALCPQCQGRISHVRAPDRLTETGHAWAWCKSCGLSADRDDAAGRNIGARALDYQDQYDAGAQKAKTRKATSRYQRRRKRSREELPQLQSREQIPHAVHPTPCRLRQQAARAVTAPVVAPPPEAAGARRPTSRPVSGTSGPDTVRRDRTAAPAGRQAQVRDDRIPLLRTGPGPCDGTRWSLRQHLRASPVRRARTQALPDPA